MDGTLTWHGKDDRKILNCTWLVSAVCWRKHWIHVRIYLSQERSVDFFWMPEAEQGSGIRTQPWHVSDPKTREGWVQQKRGSRTEAGGGWLFFGRSPTVVVAYLMRHGNLRLAESYKWVKDRRPSINITAGDAICGVDWGVVWVKNCGENCGVICGDICVKFCRITCLILVAVEIAWCVCMVWK